MLSITKKVNQENVKSQKKFRSKSIGHETIIINENKIAFSRNDEKKSYCFIVSVFKDRPFGFLGIRHLTGTALNADHST